MPAGRSALVLQFMHDDEPGYLGTWAQRNGLSLEVVNAATGQSFPRTIGRHRALAVLGGAMGANDDLPFLRDAERLILECMDREIPVLGHCLGGQLMARSLGAAVGDSPAPEVGWHPMSCLESPSTLAWLGPQPTHMVFHWHYDAFELPRGATALATSPACPVQAFAVGPHLAMQFHVEIDAAKIDAWLAQPDARYRTEAKRHPTVQPLDNIRRLTASCLTAQQLLAQRIYARWLEGSLSR